MVNLQSIMHAYPTKKMFVGIHKYIFCIALMAECQQNKTAGVTMYSDVARTIGNTGTVSLLSYSC